MADGDVQRPSGGSITDVDVRIDELRHTFLGDLQIQVEHDGVTGVLFANPGGGNNAGNDIVDAIFDSDAGATLPTTTGPITGRVRTQPANALDVFDGHPAGGHVDAAHHRHVPRRRGHAAPLGPGLAAGPVRARRDPRRGDRRRVGRRHVVGDARRHRDAQRPRDGPALLLRHDDRLRREHRRAGRRRGRRRRRGVGGARGPRRGHDVPLPRRGDPRGRRRRGGRRRPDVHDGTTPPAPPPAAAATTTAPVAPRATRPAPRIGTITREPAQGDQARAQAPGVSVHAQRAGFGEAHAHASGTGVRRNKRCVKPTRTRTRPALHASGAGEHDDAVVREGGARRGSRSRRPACPRARTARRSSRPTRPATARRRRRRRRSRSGRRAEAAHARRASRAPGRCTRRALRRAARGARRRGAGGRSSGG